jgi:hypothetical protein
MYASPSLKECHVSWTSLVYSSRVPHIPSGKTLPQLYTQTSPRA